MFFKKNISDKKIGRFETNTYLLLSILLIFSVIFIRENTLSWVAVAISTFAILGNDSPQLIGTYLASKKDEKWQKTFLFVGSILVAVLFLGWRLEGGEIHFKILDNVTPRQINIYYVLAPIVLLILTHFAVPTSSTFLILSTFLDRGNVIDMLIKTAASYFFSCTVSGYACYAILKRYKKYMLYTELSKDKYARVWGGLQSFSTGLLIMAWVCFSVSNIAVFLPRKLTLHELVLFLTIILYVLVAILSNKNNNKMQKIVSNKSNANNLRLNVITNTIFAVVLFLFKVMSNISIATTFVFLGILAGKELALVFSEGGASKIAYKKTLFSIIIDVKKCIIGVIVSLCFVSFIGFLNIL